MIWTITILHSSAQHHQHIGCVFEHTCDKILKNLQYTLKRMALWSPKISKISNTPQNKWLSDVSLCLCVVLLFVNICTQIGIFHMGTGSETCDKISLKKTSSQIGSLHSGTGSETCGKTAKTGHPDRHLSYGDWLRNL